MERAVNKKAIKLLSMYVLLARVGLSFAKRTNYHPIGVRGRNRLYFEYSHK